MADHNLISHTQGALHHIKEYWEIFSALALTLWGGVLLARRNVRAGLATKEELRQCHAQLSNEIRRNREVNTSEHTELMTIILRHIDK